MYQRGFTIVELIIIVVVISILTTLSVVGFGTIQRQAAIATLQSDLKQAATQLELLRVDETGNLFPASLELASLTASEDTTLEYSYYADTNTYCLSARTSRLAVPGYHLTNTSPYPIEGVCAGHVDPLAAEPEPEPEPEPGPEPEIPPQNNTVLASSLHSCTVGNGRAYCWGQYNNGILGNGTQGTSYRTTPAGVTRSSGILSGKTVTAISAGLYHTCAIADGQVFCWGQGTYGALGRGNTTGTTTPVAVDTTGVLSGKTVTAISAGLYHTCAIADGRAYCWGQAEYGKLGDNNTTTNRVSPVAVNTSGVLAGKTVTRIGAGHDSTCAVADGKAYCWGQNEYGKLGNGSATNSSVPVAVSTSGVLANKTVTAISTGDWHACAVADERAYCWGRKFSGIIGNGVNDVTGPSQYESPVAVTATGVLANRSVTTISAGRQHTCAVASGRAFCWGQSYQGRVGNGSGNGGILNPASVSTSGVLSGKTVTAISAGEAHTCAVADGATYCWGQGANGRLGNNDTANALTPVAISALP